MAQLTANWWQYSNNISIALFEIHFSDDRRDWPTQRVYLLQVLRTFQGNHIHIISIPWLVLRLAMVKVTCTWCYLSLARWRWYMAKANCGLSRCSYSCACLSIPGGFGRASNGMQVHIDRWSPINDRPMTMDSSKSNESCLKHGRLFWIDWLSGCIIIMMERRLNRRTLGFKSSPPWLRPNSHWIAISRGLYEMCPSALLWCD